MIDKFSPEVLEELNHYVYRLIDPRDGQTFYVGMGKGDRVFDHVKGEIKLSKKCDDDEVCRDEASEKIQQIKQIREAGFEVIHVIQRYGMEENEAREVEAALIDCFPGLTNQQRGYASDRGVINAETLNKILSAKPFEEKEDIDFCIIKIRQETIDSCGSVYEAVRKSWKVNKNKIEKIPYILASCNGLVKEVYKVDRWMESDEVEGRYMFEGEVADEEIQTIFKDKKLPEKYMNKGAANPVRYKK